MSKYTTEVRFICEELNNLEESSDYLDVYQIVANAAPQIFRPYPIFDESYRAGLNQRILLHFYTREIGFETVGLWKLKLNQKLMEIMPYYNQLYESTRLEYNPLFDVDYTVTDDNKEGEGRKLDEGIGTKRNEDVDEKEMKDIYIDTTLQRDIEAKTNQTANNLEVRKRADTPQVANSEPLFTQYLTNAEQDQQNNQLNGTSETDQNDTSHQAQNDTRNATRGTSESISTDRGLSEERNKTFNAVRHTAGKMGTASYAKMILEYRETMLNIDMMIIRDLEDCFMGLW